MGLPTLQQSCLVGSARDSPEGTGEGLLITTPTLSQACYSHPSFQPTPTPSPRVQNTLYLHSL